MSGLLRAALVLAGIAVALALAEVLIRIAGPALPAGYTSRALQARHPVYGTFHRPGASAWVHDPEFTTFVRFDRQGLRGTEAATEPASGRARVLVLGDSFVEGAEVDERETLTASLGETLAGLGRPAEVLNAGVRGWGTAQEYLYLSREGLDLRPDVVVLMLYVGNDLVDNSRELSDSAPDGAPDRPWYALEGDQLVLTPPSLPPPSLLEPLLATAGRRSALFNLAESGVVAKLGLGDAEEVLRSVHRLAFAAPPSPAWERSWAVTEALLVAIRDAAAARGVPLLLVVAPHKAQLDPVEWERLVRGPPPAGQTWDPIYPQRRLAALAAAHGIQHLDLLPILRAAASDAPLYFARNSHWTAAGHRVVGAAIARALAGLLPTGG